MSIERDRKPDAASSEGAAPSEGAASSEDRRLTGRRKHVHRRHVRRSNLRRQRALRMLRSALLVVAIAAVSSYCASSGEQAAAPAWQPANDAPHAYASVAGAGGAPAGLQGGARLRPDDHTVAWMQRHGTVARAGASDCMSCHQEDDCATCHTADLAEPFSVHPPNFTLVHALDARLSPQNCTSCHQVETFCTQCHMRTGVSAIDGFRPPTRTQFHPAGWLDAQNPANHGVQARRDITDCASCHREQDCVSCHVGINPHPPEFRLDCASWLRADPRSCAQCHGAELDTLGARCF